MIIRWKVAAAIIALATMGTLQQCEAGFILSLNESDLQADGPGPLSRNVDLIISHDGNGENTTNSFTIDFTLDSPLTLADSNNTTDDNPLGFNIGAVVLDNSASFASFGANVVVPNGGSTRVTTLQFGVPEGINDQSFNIGLTLVDASRANGFLQNDISGEFTVQNAVFTVNATAVPEPASVLAIGLIAAVGIVRTRRVKTKNT